MKATINLFKAVPIEKKGVKKEASENLLKRTVSCGFVFAPEVVANYTEKELFKIADDVEKVVGISGRHANMTFHKSWAKVKDTPIEQLLFEQFLHYLTTYGFEAFGIDSDFVFIPTEKLEIPEIQKEIPLIVIKGYTKEELKEKIFQLLSTGIALKEETIHDVVDVALFTGFVLNDVEKVKNKEVRIVLYSRLGLVPSNNIEFLRYIVYMTTGKTLIIKNDETIDAIKQYNMFVVNAFEKYKNEYGFEKLAEIFYRFKPIFLALRTNAEMNKNINRIRRLAKRYHRPMKVDYINNVTALVKKGQVDKKELEKELKKVNIYRKVRLANALKYRTIDTHSILYKIRNGKAYATPFNVDNQEKMKEILEIVLKSIAFDIEPKVRNKKIYIPEYVLYTFPTSEKNFVGNMPAGSSVVVPNNLIFGIHWENYQKKRIDLDLSLLDATTGEKIGWDGEYRTEEGTILFSGDVTDAKPPDGASEVYYIDQKATKQYLIGLNFYNFYDLHLGEIPYKFFVGSKEVSELSHNYVVDPNSIILTFSSKIEIARIIGLLVATLEKNKIFFVDMKMSSARTFSNAKYNAWAQEYLFASSENTIDLRTILEMSGAQMVKKEECEIDLSPEVLEKDTIINLIGQ